MNLLFVGLFHIAREECSILLYLCMSMFLIILVHDFLTSMLYRVKSSFHTRCYVIITLYSMCMYHSCIGCNQSLNKLDLQEYQLK